MRLNKLLMAGKCRSAILTSVMQEVRALLEVAVTQVAGKQVPVVLSRPDEQFGDYATNVALQLAKELGKNPREVAEAIVAAVGTSKVIAEATIAGPGFINIRVQTPHLADYLQTLEAQAPRGFGSSDSGKGQTVLCEFPSPNIAKPFSVGHIRAALQGWSIYKLMDFTGYRVVRDNHLGDHGTPFGKWVVGYLAYSSPQQLEQDGVYELARIYIAITKDLKEEKEQGGTELADKVQDWLVKLEAGDGEAVGYSQQFTKISLDHMHSVMQRLRIATDEELGESFYVRRGQEMADELLKKGQAELSKGAVIVSLEDQGIDTPLMLRKANGAALYATTDLATIEYRDKQWQPEHIFIHTGQEQAFYFQQLKALCRQLGYPDNIEHLWHGLIDVVSDEGKREKMSSRKGVILLEELLDRAHAKARTLMPEASEEDVEAVALGAIKFTDFKADRKTGVLFDWEAMFNVHGFSGPAIQYAAVRIASILKKLPDASTLIDASYDWQAEHALLVKLADFPPLLEELRQNYELHKLAHYLYELAQAFNRYYEQTRIVEAEPQAQAARVWTIQLVQATLQNGLDILGIPTPQQM